jgi:hypothetical protein
MARSQIVKNMNPKTRRAVIIAIDFRCVFGGGSPARNHAPIDLKISFRMFVIEKLVS